MTHETITEEASLLGLDLPEHPKLVIIRAVHRPRRKRHERRETVVLWNETEACVKHIRTTTPNPLEVLGLRVPLVDSEIRR